MARLFREDFDWERDFVALRSFVFNAKGYVPGQPIVKQGAFTLRRLRQLFDQRAVGFPNEYWDKLGFVPPGDQQPPVPLAERPQAPPPDTPEPPTAPIARRRLNIAPEGGKVPRRRAKVA